MTENWIKSSLRSKAVRASITILLVGDQGMAVPLAITGRLIYEQTTPTSHSAREERIHTYDGIDRVMVN